MQQLLWLETLLKLIPGLLLALAPLTTLRILGLPRPDTGFWPRLCGALLVGIAGALFSRARPAAMGSASPAASSLTFAGPPCSQRCSFSTADRPPRAGARSYGRWCAPLIILSVVEIATL